MRYEIRAYQKMTTYDKCWIEVEADSPEEALHLVKEDPEHYEQLDSKCVDVSDSEYVDKDQWEVCK